MIGYSLWNLLYESVQNISFQFNIYKMTQMCLYRYDTKQCYLEKFGKFSDSTKTLLIP